MTLVAKEVKKVTVWRGSTRLPSEYQEVEYIEGSGGPYLKIGNYFNTSYIMEAKYQMQANGAITLGCNRGSRTPYRRYGLITNSSITNVIAGGSSWTDLGLPGTDVHTIKIQGSTAYYDGVAYSISYSANLGINYGLGVFVYNNPNLPTSSGDYGKVFYLKISDSNETPLYDLVPCYRKADGEIGMYDLVTNTFYTNAGTGTFTKGNDVGGLQEIQVRPTGWQPGANTLLYMPLSSNANDVQGHTTTTGGTVRFGSYGGVDCADFTSRGHINITPFALGNSYTILARANNVNGAYESNGGRVVDLGNPRVGIAYRSPEGYYTYENNDYFGVTTQNAWFLTAVVVTGSTGVGYLKGNGVDDTSSLVSCFNSGTPTAFNIGNEYNNGANRYFLGYISNVIVEDKARTAQEVADYYNSTKGNYGL